MPMPMMAARPPRPLAYAYAYDGRPTSTTSGLYDETTTMFSKPLMFGVDAGII